MASPEGDPVRGAGWGGLLRGVGDGRKESEPLVGATFCLRMHLDLTDAIMTTSSTFIESENYHWNLPVRLEELILDYYHPIALYHAFHY